MTGLFELRILQRMRRSSGGQSEMRRRPKRVSDSESWMYISTHKPANCSITSYQIFLKASALRTIQDESGNAFENSRA